MRVEVTHDCAGTGQCVAIAPDFFELGDDGLSSPTATPATPEQIELVRTAAGMCPMAAIEVED